VCACVRVSCVRYRGSRTGQTVTAVGLFVTRRFLSHGTVGVPMGPLPYFFFQKLANVFLKGLTVFFYCLGAYSLTFSYRVAHGGRAGGRLVVGW